MPTSTYVPLATITLASTDSEIVFSSIPATYRDLVLVSQFQSANTTSFAAAAMKFNGDTGSNYPHVQMNGEQSRGVTSYSATDNFLRFGPAGMNGVNEDCMSITQIMDYSATDKHTTVLTRWKGELGTDNDIVGAHAGRWANTDAVTQINLYTTTSSVFKAGSTFSLFGIAA